MATEETMINHLSIGVSDLERAKTFYDAVLAPLGYSCLSADAGSLGYGRETPSLWILASRAPVAADPRSGLHICFDAPNRTAVDLFHSAGLAAGGEDNGQAGLRSDYGPNYYAAFLCDPDGYRVEAYCGAEA
jgi:catechol 2,3-dioxygenase-like lactoylglutathione lyase family enzyme